MKPRAEKMGLDPEKLRELLAQQLEDKDSTTAQPEASSTQGGDATDETTEELHFDLKPEELEAYLDQYVIKQREAKAILATKICTPQCPSGGTPSVSLAQARDEEVSI